MTDRIDLDEMDVESEDGPDANRGDWVWRDDGDPDDEPDEGWLDGVGTAAEAGDGASVAGEQDADENEGDAEAEEKPDRDPLPGVPRENRDRPVGVPIEGGGAGGGAAPDRGDGEGSAGKQAAGSADDHGTGLAGDQEGAPSASTGGESPDSAATAGGETHSTASGPHGGGVDDMTMALTYEAVQRLDDPRFAVIDARGWTDWIGIVGDVPAYEINAFQREHEIDADFFSGAGQGPAERLADIDEHSMFYAERMVLVGVDGEQPIADRADWEFVHLETAAEKAGWDLSEEA